MSGYSPLFPPAQFARCLEYEDENGRGYRVFLFHRQPDGWAESIICVITDANYRLETWKELDSCFRDFSSQPRAH